ncbi:MAG: efflux transporter outer membrane subunit [Planctomycetota bacterium]
MRSETRLGALAAALLPLVGACRVGPDYTPPELALPDAWHRELAGGLSEGPAELAVWWTTLDDPVLARVIERVGEGNLDLRATLARVREAQALRGVAASERKPTVDGVGAANRSRSSEGVAGFLPPPQERVIDFYSAVFDAFWELDVWGRISRQVDAADASLEASVEAYRDVLVLLQAEAALSYLDVRTLQARLGYARGNVELQERTKGLTDNRFNSGLSAELDVRQAELNLATTESLIPLLESQLVQAMHRLDVLVGGFPGELREELSAVAAIPSPPDSAAVGLPADLLRRRPDVRQAERQLAAQTALVGVATASLYPQFTLVGTLGLEAFENGDFFDSRNRAYSFGPSFRWPIFNAGRVRAQIDAEEARTEQALAAYEQTVRLALEEVENATVAFARERERAAALARAVAAAQRSVELVETQYKTGITNFQNVLDTQRQLFGRQDELAESQGLVVQRLVLLYKALGGGWSAREETEQADSTTSTDGVESTP